MGVVLGLGILCKRFELLSGIVEPTMGEGLVIMELLGVAVVGVPGTVSA